MKALPVVATTTDRYTIMPVIRFALSGRHIDEIRSYGMVGHRATKATIKKVMLAKPRKNITVWYALYRSGDRLPWKYRWSPCEAYHSGQMAKIGCMIFRGLEYRKLRKWALT